MELNEIKERIEGSFADRFQSTEELCAFCQTVMDHVVNVDGYINLDFNDVLNTLENAESMKIGTKTGDPDHLFEMLNEVHADIMKMCPNSVPSTVLLQIQFDRSSGLEIEKINCITEFMDVYGEDVNIIWGVGFDNTLGADVRITLVEGYKTKK